jgi:hypothetical protein
MKMRSLSLLLLLFGPVLSLPAAAGLGTWSMLSGQAMAPFHALAATVAAGLLVFVLVRRPGLLREIGMLALSAFWAGWLWLALTEKDYNWTRLPEPRATTAMDRVEIVLIVLVYLMIYVVAEECRREPRRPT